MTALSPELFLAKTDKGQDEIRNRSSGLNPRLRSLLVMIDGTKPVAELARCAASLGGGLDFLQSLLEGGFVRPVGAAARPIGVDVPSGAAAAPADDPAVVAKGKGVLRRYIKLAPLSEARALNKAVDAVHVSAELARAAEVVAAALSAAGNPEAAATLRDELVAALG